jgi:hypothetical protein
MTLAELRTSARRKADEEASGFISEDEANDYINQGMRYVYTKIAQRFENHFVQPGTALNGGLFSTTSGTSGYSLPTDLMKIVRVEHRTTGSTSDNDWRRLATTNIANDRMDDYYPLREGYMPGFGYFIAGNSIYLKPVPQQSFQIRIWYVPKPTALSLDASEPAVPSEYHELIAEYAAIQMLAKSGEGIWRERSDAFKLELENMLETIESRDQVAEQMVITDDYDYLG